MTKSRHLGCRLFVIFPLQKEICGCGVIAAGVTARLAGGLATGRSTGPMTGPAVSRRSSRMSSRGLASGAMVSCFGHADLIGHGAGLLDCLVLGCLSLHSIGCSCGRAG
jgi:hypothetical protein